MTAKICVALLLLATTVCQVRADVSEPSDAPKNEDERLLIEIVSAGVDFSECVRQQPSEIVSDKAMRHTDPDVLMVDAESVLGASHPAVFGAKAPQLSSAQRVALLLKGLGEFAAEPGADEPAAQFPQSRRAKAAALALVVLAAQTDGRCVPDPNYLAWLKEVPNADQ